MIGRSDQSLRRLTLVVLVAYATLTVLTIAMTSGLGGHPGLASSGAAKLDYGPEIDSTALVIAGLVLTWLRPRNSIGWLLTLSGMLNVVCNAGQVYGTRALVIPTEHLPLGALALSITAPLWIPSLLIPPTNLLLRYPSGTIAGRWDRRFDRAVIASFVVLWFGYATSSNSVTDEVKNRQPPLHLPVIGGVLMAAGAAVIVASLLLIAISTVRRMLHAGFPERQQIAWLLTTTFPAFVLVFLPVAWLGTIGFAFVSVAIVVGVLRYRLLGIEVVVRRALLYGTLTGLVLLVFVVVTTSLAVVIPRGPAPDVVAASLIAVGLVPVRDRLQRIVDRIVYGERNDPWTALQRLSTPLEGPTETDVLPAILAAVARAVRAPGAALLAVDDIVVATSGEASPTGVRVAVRYSSEELGSLVIAPRRGEKTLAAADRRLLDAIAPLVAAVWYASRLADDLTDARARLVEATEAERDRLRRELHDGLGPSLTGIGLGLEAVERASGARQAALVTRLRTEATRSLDEVRRIIDDLRPGALTDLDLLAALRERVAQVNANSAVHVDLCGPASLDLPPEIEAAAYRIADEAIVNVLKHASATRCTVTVRIDDCLHLSVADDGVGLHANGRSGVGLGSMRQRAAVLGGTFDIIEHDPGLEVMVALPVGPVAAR
jgi:two-component system, NarL family, sensor kinase